MRAEIISVGTELLLGQTVNTDASFLGRELALLGIDLHNVEVVGDNSERLSEVLTMALQRSDLIITTGGLGPTLDDLTKKTVATVVGKELVLHEECLAKLKEYFGSRDMGENQLNQAFLPEGAIPLHNDCGTAPGCAITLDSGTLVMLFPGPPRELQTMFNKYAMPILQQKIGASIYSAKIRTVNQGEGDTARKLGDLCNNANPTVATYIGDYHEIYVRVTAKAPSQEEAITLVEPMVQQVQDILGDVVYGVNVNSLEEVVVNLLAQRHEEVATAESCTGGLLAKRLTDISGSSAVFKTGLVTYANETKTRLLGVPEELLASKGAVSPEVAQYMATEVRKRSQADYGLGITGIAGPGGGTPTKPVGLVYIALSCKEHCYVTSLIPQGRYLGRDFVRIRSCNVALDMLRRYLQQKPVLF